MCFEYDDTPLMQSVRQVKCRQPHKCSGCYEFIARGEMAECSSGLFDGAWFADYLCDRCQRLRLRIVEQELLHGCAWHTAWCSPHDMREYIEEVSQHSEPITPIGMPTIADCRRYIDNVYERTRMIELEAY